jgi:hypothetical protein
MMYDGLNHLCGNAKNSGTNAAIPHAHIGGELRLVAEQLTNLEMLRLAKADASRGRTFRQHLQAAIAEGFNGWSIGRDGARRKGFFIEDSLFPRNPLTKKGFCAFTIEHSL